MNERAWPALPSEADGLPQERGAEDGEQQAQGVPHGHEHGALRRPGKAPAGRRRSLEGRRPPRRTHADGLRATRSVSAAGEGLRATPSAPPAGRRCRSLGGPLCPGGPAPAGRHPLGVGRHPARRGGARGKGYPEGREKEERGGWGEEGDVWLEDKGWWIRLWWERRRCMPC